MENNSTVRRYLVRRVINTELNHSDMHSWNVFKSVIQPCEICIYTPRKFCNIVTAILLFIRKIGIDILRDDRMLFLIYTSIEYYTLK